MRSSKRREFVHLSDALHEYIANFDARSHELSGVATGFVDLDRMTGGLQKSDLIVLASTAAHGDTAFAMSVIHHCAVRFGYAVAVFSLRETKGDCIHRLLTIDAGLDLHRTRRGQLYDEEFERLNSSIGRIGETDIFVDDSADIKVAEIQAKLEQLMDEHRCDLIVLDSLDHMARSNSYLYSDAPSAKAAICRDLKNVAREFDRPLLAVNRLPECEFSQIGESDAAPRRVTSDIDLDADLVLLLYRDEVLNPDTDQPNMAKILVAKHRNGSTGSIDLYFQPSQQRFRDFNFLDTNVS